MASLIFDVTVQSLKDNSQHNLHLSYKLEPREANVTLKAEGFAPLNMNINGHGSTFQKALQQLNETLARNNYEIVDIEIIDNTVAELIGKAFIAIKDFKSKKS